MMKTMGASSPGRFNDMCYIEVLAPYQRGSGVVPGSGGRRCLESLMDAQSVSWGVS